VVAVAAVAPIPLPDLAAPAQYLVVAAVVAAVLVALQVLVVRAAMAMFAFGAGNHDLCNS
jgi:hypothetical protein